MKKLPLLLIGSLLFASCYNIKISSSTRYYGKIYAPTSEVDIFFRESEIKKEYELMGRVILNYFQQSDKQIDNLKELAKQKGADAVLSPISEADKSVFSTAEEGGKTVVIKSESSDISVYFLKYK